MPNVIFQLRAALGNFELPTKVNEIIFRDFSIKTCPNQAYMVQLHTEDGDDVDWQYPTNPDPLYPICDYYLEANINAEQGHAWATASLYLPWFLTRLRLYKPEHLWGSLFSVTDKTQSRFTTGIDDINASRQRRHSRPPSKGLTVRPNFYTISEFEIDKIKNFINGFENVPPDYFKVAIRRFNQFFDRDTIEDRAVDLFISLESLLSEGSDAIGYKIALRASHLIGTNPQEKLNSYNFIKSAYSQRSNIVHGTRNASNWLNDHGTDRSPNVDRLAEIVRLVLLKMLEYSKNGTKLDSSNIDETLFFNS